MTTPGPWAVWNFADDPRHVAVGPEAGGLAVADVVACNAHGCYTAATEERGQANARLIAAAPAMLAALRGLAEAVERFTNATPEDWPELFAARAAIFQAKQGQIKEV